MKSLSSIEVNFIIKELKQIEGARLDKVFQQENEFLLKLYKLKNIFLDIIPGHFAILTQEKSFESEPTQFCMILRKYLTSTTLEKIEQLDFERIIMITFKYKEETYNLIIELFSTGNIILTKENKIIACLEKKEFKDRKIQPGIDYQRPPQNAPNIKDLKSEEFSKILDESKKESLVKKLAIDFGMGGTYAEEILARSKIQKDIKNISQEHKQILLNTIKNLLDKQLSPNISKQEAYPIKLITKPIEQEVETFSQAIEKTKDILPIQPQKNKEQESLNNILKTQEEQLKDLELKIVQYKEIGDQIYKNYGQIEQLIKEIKETKWKTDNPKIIEKLPDEYKIIIEV